MQRNWIGRSTGAAVLFATDRGRHRGVHHPARHAVRRDLYGAGARARAGRPAGRGALAGRHRPAVDVRRRHPGRGRAAYRATIAAKSDLERQENKAKTGVFLGATRPIRPTANRYRSSSPTTCWPGYGTGAIMAVPGRDQRDWEFATQFGLPIVEVDCRRRCFAGRLQRRRRAGELRLPQRAERRGGQGGHHRAAGGRRPRPGPHRIQAARLAFRAAAVLGRAVPDRLRRATAARTRCPSRRCRSNCRTCRTIRRCSSTPTTPTASRRRRWARRPTGCNVELDLGDGLKPYTRDTNVMPQWAGSSWYELRYTDPHNSEAFCAKENEAYWMGPRPAEHGPDDPGGVDLYVGGVEHAVLHLLYSPVLAQGALRPRPRQLPRAVPAAGQPGLHPGVRLHRRPRLLRAGRRGRRAGRRSSSSPAPTARSRSTRSSARSARA